MNKIPEDNIMRDDIGRPIKRGLPLNKTNLTTNEMDAYMLDINTDEI